MAKLTGYNRVAVIEQGGRDYHFALYDDDIKVGDDVLIKSGAQYYTMENIKDIITPEEAAERFNKDITAEIICKVDLFAYEARLFKRKEAAELDRKANKLKKDIDKRVKELESQIQIEEFAKNDPKLAEMLNEYKGLAK